MSGGGGIDWLEPFGRSAVQLWLLAPVCEFEFFLPTAGTVVFHLTIATPLPACQENLTILSPDIRTQVIPHTALSEVGGAVGIGAADPPGVVAFDVPPNSPPPLQTNCSIFSKVFCIVVWASNTWEAVCSEACFSRGTPSGWGGW